MLLLGEARKDKSAGALLFIDDEDGIRRSIVRALGKEPYRVVTAGSGTEGIGMIREDRTGFETVISDYRMPGIDGLETLVAIGRLNPEITRIILTGYATLESAIQATNHGVDGFLTKPFDNLQLRASIREISIRKRLRHFIPEQIYREIQNSPGAIAPRFSDVTILFSDIRGFTEMSHRSAPELIASFLNEEYFSPMGEIAYAHGGMVDKHIGDGIMVVFGAPMARDDDALRAVQTAVEMQQQAKQIDLRLSKNGSFRLKTGIGICTGKAFSGVLGSLRKKEFTSIGSAVNLAARLEKMAVAGEVLLNEETHSRVSEHFPCDRVGPVQVRGMQQPVPVYRVVF